MHIAAYIRVSTDDQNEDRQMRAIRQKYSEEENSNEFDWYCDLGESGASTSRREYQRLREHVAKNDVVVAHELDRLASEGRATALSGVSMGQAVVFLVARAAGGSLAERTPPLTALALLGTFAVIAIVVIRITADPFESPSVVHP